MVITWKTKALQAIFEPKTIAIIGASDKPRKLGSLTLRALQASQFPGTIYLVHPTLKKLKDEPVYSRVQDIPDDIDLALIAVQNPHVPQVLTDCAEKAIHGAVIFSAGFKELGLQGKALEDEIARIANDAHIGIVGPNCLGVGNIPRHLNATFFPYPTPISPGKVSLVSQSGGVAGLMLYAAVDTQLGIAKFASIGNRVNLDFADFLQYFKDDPDTEVICLFIEGTEDARRLIDTAHQVTVAKPILAYKVGKTPVAQRATISHTGSLAGRGELYSSAFRQAGIQEVTGVSELIDTAKAISILPYLPHGKRVACVTHTLGPTIIAAEILESHGIELPQPKPETVRGIQQVMGLPIDLPIDNPIDLLALGWARPEIFAKALRLTALSDQYDAFLTIFSPNFQEDIGGGTPTEGLLEVMQEVKKPIISVLNSPTSHPPPEKAILEASGIPVFASPERGAKALANIISYSLTAKRVLQKQYPTGISG
ncbi:MAG: acetate--CoA ligase family protein [Candidatus Hodarchaeota archaeon]